MVQATILYVPLQPENECITLNQPHIYTIQVFYGTIASLQGNSLRYESAFASPIVDFR